MRTHYKLFSCLAIVFFMTFSSCQKDETLNLDSWPMNRSALMIADAEDKASEITVNATYDHEGNLVFDKPVDRTYTFRIVASPEEATVTFEPLLIGISEKNVELSTTKVIVPVGFTDASVTLTAKDGNWEFARSNYDVADYELGVKATVTGYQMPTDTLEAKVMIKKEAYVATCSLEGKNDNTALFELACFNGQIVKQDPISYVFRIQLDRPARKDVKITLMTTGIDEKYMKDITITPAETVIPAGKVSSGDITWSITDDFLLREEGNLSDVLKVDATIDCEDPVVVQNEQKASFTLYVNKLLRAFDFLPGKPAGWTEWDKTGWSVESNARGNPNSIIDGTGGQSGSDIYGHDMLWFTVDLQSEKELSGAGIDYYKNYGKISCPQKVHIWTSSDNVTWTDQGVVNTTVESSHYFRFFNLTNARYIKFELFENSGKIIDVSEVYLYKY